MLCRGDFEEDAPAIEEVLNERVRGHGQRGELSTQKMRARRMGRAERRNGSRGRKAGGNLVMTPGGEASPDGARGDAGHGGRSVLGVHPRLPSPAPPRLCWNLA